jgi:hypothetical protein
MMPPTLKWGAGLSIVLSSLPNLLIPPVTIILVPTLLARILSPDYSPWGVGNFLKLPAYMQTAILWVLFVFSRRTIREYQRQTDRKRLGSDVIEVPRVKLNWPWNLDLIPFIMRSRETGRAYWRSDKAK